MAWVSCGVADEPGRGAGHLSYDMMMGTVLEGGPLKKQKTFEQAFQGATRMSEKYVEKGAYEFYPDADIVEEVQKGLAKNEVEFGYRYCP